MIFRKHVCKFIRFFALIAIMLSLSLSEIGCQSQPKPPITVPPNTSWHFHYKVVGKHIKIPPCTDYWDNVSIPYLVPGPPD